jgi:hypothetical protein
MTIKSSFLTIPEDHMLIKANPVKRLGTNQKAYTFFTSSLDENKSLKILDASKLYGIDGTYGVDRTFYHKP